MTDRAQLHNIELDEVETLTKLRSQKQRWRDNFYWSSCAAAVKKKKKLKLEQEMQEFCFKNLSLWIVSISTKHTKLGIGNKVSLGTRCLYGHISPHQTHLRTYECAWFSLKIHIWDNSPLLESIAVRCAEELSSQSSKAASLNHERSAPLTSDAICWSSQWNKTFITLWRN